VTRPPGLKKQSQYPEARDYCLFGNICIIQSPAKPRDKNIVIVNCIILFYCFKSKIIPIFLYYSKILKVYNYKVILVYLFYSFFI